MREKNRHKVDSIKHRGIQYTEIVEDGWIYGHHRLPIQTLEDDEWTQPIKFGGGFFLFNGEIFNYDKEKYDSDVEYLKDFFSGPRPQGEFENEINKWDGFWSIVVVFTETGNRFVFTDPLGKKQLYYNGAGEISSEIKDLTESHRVDKQMVSTIKKWGYNYDDKTIYQDVKRIMPNKIYKFGPDNEIPTLDHSDYFKWDENVPDRSIHDLLEESVSRRLLSKKYKVSTLFSGGLDSTIILYFLRKLGADVNIYSIDNGADGDMVRFMEKRWNLNINYLNPEIDNINLEEKLKIYDVNDGPIDLGSVLPQYYLFKDIKDKIVLTGDGADELFGGYRRIAEYDSQYSDVFQELPFYHLLRIDRMSMNFTIECRNPFLGHDVIRKALTLPYSERMHKKHFKRSI
ncbi:MAG: hypothetical protein HC831_18975 [Chloroflexia bacterium]|nr:hypothetical protein [Chloroflexia bacterium]